MADQIIDIPGVGQVAFPDTMSESQVTAAAAKLYREGQAGAPAPEKPPLSVSETVGQTAIDLVKGAGKALINSGVRGGALLRKIPGVDALSNALPSIGDPSVPLATPSNTAQKIGGVAEQVAEVVNPSRAVFAMGRAASAKAAPILAKVLSPALAKLVPTMAVEAAGNAALSKAQGGSNAEAGVSGVIGAAVPAAAQTFGSVAVGIANKLRAQAGEHVSKFFSPTKEGMKRIVAKRTPEVLERAGEVLGGVGRNRAGAAEVFAEQRQAAGEAVDEALKQFGADEVKDAPSRLMAALDTAKAPYVKTRIVSQREGMSPANQRYVVGTMPDGRVQLAIPRNAAKVKQIDGLKEIVRAHGDAMTVDDLVGLRKAWDEIAYAKPAFGQVGPGESAKWAKKMGGDAIRGIVGSDKPELAAINREFSFWKDLETVMEATNTRKIGQVGGVLPSMAQGAGQVAGAVSHGLSGALAVGKAAKTLQQIFASPRYASLAANYKNALADALASGDKARIESLANALAIRVGAVEVPRLVGAAVSP